MAQVTHFMYGTSSTYRADAFTSASATNVKEGQITAAIAAAVADGVQAVFVPQSMLPYNASLVTFNNAVWMLREGGAPTVYDVRAYGAAGDSITNDAPAIQAALNAATANSSSFVSGMSHGIVYLPPGTYAIGSALSLSQVTGARIVGAGMFNTKLYVTANMATVLSLEGFGWGMVSDFTVEIAPAVAVTNIILVTCASQATEHSSGFQLERLFLGQNSGATNTCVNGIAIGTDNTNMNDTFSVRDVTILGNWSAGNITTSQNGLLAGNGSAGNTLNFDIHHLYVFGFSNSLSFQGAGAIDVLGAFLSGANICINTQGVQSYTSIQAVRCELSQQFLGHASNSGGQSGIRIADVEFSCAALTADTNVIDIRASGVTILQNVRFQGVGAFIPKVTCHGVSTAPIVLVDGLVQGPFTVAQTFGSGFGSVIIRGYVQTATGAGSAITATVLQQVYNSGNFTPQVATIIGAASQDASIALVSGVTPALNAALGNNFTLTILTNIAVVIAVPTNPPPAGQSQTIRIVVRNGSGGVLGTAPTFNTGASGFKFSAVTNPANGTQVEYLFAWDPVQSFWYEVGTHLAAGL